VVYYYSVPEVLAQKSGLSAKGLRVSGHVRPGSIQRDPDQSEVKFLVYDRPTQQQLEVVFRGLIPDTFKDDAEVVVEGRFSAADRRFRAATLLAKCPSKYEGKADAHPAEVPVSQAGK
jgi:cytochrome c-type biogenesis protein CcmE